MNWKYEKYDHYQFLDISKISYTYRKGKWRKNIY